MGDSASSHIAAVILAAGAGTRMGRIKQLLPYRDGTLLQHAIKQAAGAGFSPLLVVVGAEADAVSRSIAELPVEIVVNECWQNGMGSSIAAGVRRLQDSELDPDAIAVLLSDQPLVEAKHLTAMRHLLDQTNLQIVAAEYNGMAGVPALFRRELFSFLTSLPGEAGARHLLRSSGLKIATFPLPEAAADIDTAAEFAALTSLAQSAVQK